MYAGRYIAVIIPALNEEEAIGLVLRDIPGYVDRIIVADNGSTDRTAGIARAGGAEVVLETERGYGAACLRALAQLDDRTDIVVFLDGDYSDFPHEMILLLDPIVHADRQVVIGSRMLNSSSRRALTPVARFGNRLSTLLIRLFWGHRFSDLGPFRAIEYDTLKALDMNDRNFGWTVELQIKAARRHLQTTEVAVSYRPRVGISKVSGTIDGSVKAGIKILYLIFREFLRR